MPFPFQGFGGRNSGRGGYGGYGGYDDDYYDEGGMGSQSLIHLRGLPFKATDEDISNVRCLELVLV